jgi:hypothetical protein
MRGRIFAGLFLCSLFFAVGGDAQSPSIPEKPVWTLELIKVQRDNLAPAMQYLKDHWMTERAEAKRQGAVLGYHLMLNTGMLENSIVLLTKYKNMDAYLENTRAAREHRNAQRFFVSGGLSSEDVFETLNTQVFVEEPDTSTGLTLLAEQ